MKAAGTYSILIALAMLAVYPICLRSYAWVRFAPTTSPTVAAIAAAERVSALPDSQCPAGSAPEAAVASPGGLSSQDRMFLQELAQCDIQQEEVSRGVIAILVSPEVREYVYTILENRNGEKNELMEMARRKGITIAPAPRIPFRHWRRTVGTVDHHFVELLNQQHERKCELIEKATVSRDPEIAAFGRENLPQVRKQWEASRELRKCVE